MFTAQNAVCVWSSMSRTEPNGAGAFGCAGQYVHTRPPSTIDLPESERQVDHAVLRPRVAGAVEAVRPDHAGQVRVETVAVAPPDDLLDQDRHLLVLDRRGRSSGRSSWRFSKNVEA